MTDKHYKRMSDETESDYIWRICLNKELGKYDLKWEDVKEILNHELDEEYTSSKWRKNFQNEYRGYNRAIEKNADVETEMEKLRVLKLEMEMEKKKIQTENVYKNRILREHGRAELLKERLEDAINNADKIPLPKFEPLQNKKSDDNEYLLTISDIHAYKIFQSITNEYSKAILEERMSKLLQEVIEVIESEKIEKITLLNAGDNIEGILRTSALSILELGVMDTVVEFRRFLAKWISDLSKYVKIDYIHLISSNHSELRPLNSRAGQFPQEDFEKDISSYIKDILDGNDRVNVIDVNTPYYHLKIAGQDVLCHHGHGIGNPKTYIDSMSRKLKIWFSSLVVGHLHSEEIKTFYEDIDGGDVEMIRVPSLVGSCGFADKINKGSKSASLMLRFNKEKGRDREYKFILN